MERSIRVAAAIIVQDGRVLAAQRGYGAMAGKWEFPGGKFEAGEDGAAACAREVREELEIEVNDLVPFAVVEYGYPSFHMHLETFLCRIARGVPRATEHAELRWLAADELAGLDWLPADIELIEGLREYLAGGGMPEAAENPRG